MSTLKFKYNLGTDKHEFVREYKPPEPNYFSGNNPTTNHNYNAYSYHPPTSEGISIPDLDSCKLGKKMKIFTYLLFVYNILLTLAVIIYSSITFDYDMLDNCLFFLAFFISFEILYISFSLRIFLKKTLDNYNICYSLIVWLSATFSFCLAIGKFAKSKLPIGHYIIFVGGISLLFVMSMVYTIISFINVTKNNL